MWIFIVLAVVVALVGAFIASRARYYGRMFSESNFRAFHEALSRAVEVFKGKGADGQPSPEDGSAFVTDAGLAIGVTFSTDENGFQALHISMSQPGRQTTHSVCSRFGFFAVAMLGGKKAELIPYFTESGVHHLVFRFQSRDVRVDGFDNAHAMYRDEYKPIPFEYRKIGSKPSLAADG